MESKDWQRVEDLYLEARALPAGERQAYLDVRCAGDDAVRREVESLLAAVAARPDFMERSALSLGMTVLARGAAEESLVGRVVGKYRILSKLGWGGMGQVYLAEHVKLDWKVALKFLSRKLVDDVWAKRQFVKEAQAVARLDHPNVCAVHGFEEDDGHSFIVMQYVEGETIAKLAGRRRLQPDEVVVLALQIAAALSHAHAHGIIHRDVKPQNVMVTTGGQVKVLDFGLAKVVQQGRDNAGGGESLSSRREAMIGTVAYMSPEQLRAERLDFRSDIFSLGTLLYELLSGANPFSRKSDAETISSILNDRPPPLTQPPAEVPPALSRIVLRCLEKDKERRYQSASELLYDLGGVGGRRRAYGFKARAASAALTLVLLLAVFTSAFLYLRPAQKSYTLVVVPVVNRSGDAGMSIAGSALTEGVSQRLSRLSLLVKVPTAVPPGEGHGGHPREVGRALGADAVLTGTIVDEGDARVLEASLVRVADGSGLWSRRYPIQQETVLEVQASLATSVALSIEPWLSRSDWRKLAHVDTENREAYLWYVRGRYFWTNRNKENILKAVECFQKAIDLDPAYARAYAGLADTYVLMNAVTYGHTETKEAMTKARWAAQEALKLDDTLPEAHTSLAIVSIKYDWDWRAAEAGLKRAIEINPNYAPARYWHSNLLFITGREKEAVAESEVAKNLDPVSSSARLNFCRAYYNLRRYDQAAACLNELLREKPGNVNAQYVLAFVYEQQGLSEQALAIFQRLYEQDKALTVAALGYAYGRAGRRADAVRLLAEMEELSRSIGYLPPFERAVVHTGLDDRDAAFAWLEKAYEERFASLPYLAVDPAFDRLRPDPRFGDLLRRLNLPPPAQPVAQSTSPN
ncbi:MAG TPA: protein kinase [Pyrinomonadaceae bacterium]